MVIPLKTFHFKKQTTATTPAKCSSYVKPDIPLHNELTSLDVPSPNGHHHCIAEDDLLKRPKAWRKDSPSGDRIPTG